MLSLSKNKSYHKQAIAISFIISAIASFLFLFNVFFSWREGMTDRLFLSEKPTVPIVIIAIDDKSLQEIGRWPWDRQVHSELLEKLKKYDPLAVGYDVNFSEKSNIQSDEKLAASIKKMGNVLLPVEATIASLDEKIIAKSFLFPINSLKKEAWGVGTTNTPIDQDGISRRTPIVIHSEDEEKILSLETMIVSCWSKEKNNELFSAKKIPLDKNGMMRINYVGKPGTFQSISAVKIINGEVEIEKIKNKIILIGATAPDLHDEYMTPVSKGRPMSGVEIIANKIYTVISENFLISLPPYIQVIILFLLSIIISYLVFHLEIIRSSVLTALLTLGYFVIALIAFDHGIIFDLFYPLVVIFFTYLVATIFQYLREAKEKKYIRHVFSRYVSKEIIDELLNDPRKVELGGEKRKVTIMFSDIRGFTTISEKLSAEELTKLINEYLTAMTDIIMNSRGVVDKYIGDAVMAFWGAPIKDPKQATIACKSALEMIEVLKEKNDQWGRRFDVELKIGIGVNTGEAVVGNMGSKKRFDYTLMGDNVNLASRLEGLTKQYGVDILTTESTFQEAKNKIVFRNLDTVAVKGKTEGTKIYEPIIRKKDCDEKIEKLIIDFEKAIKFYRSQKWTEAIRLFKVIEKENPKDGPTKIYLERCKYFKKNPPERNWDGIYRAETK